MRNGPIDRTRTWGSRDIMSKVAVVTFLAMTATTQAQQSGPLAVMENTATSGRVSRGPDALNKALDLQRRGDYEQAAIQLNLAQGLRNSLTATERAELTRLTEANRAALESRKQARDYLEQVEKAQSKGDSATVKDLCRKLLSLERYLSPQERQRVGQLGRTLGISAPTTGEGSELQVAKGKLSQARVLLGQGSFDAAEQLTREAEAMNVTYGPRDETPAKVQQDIVKGKREPKLLLLAARSALLRNDFDAADKFTQSAEQNASSFSFSLWGDSPAKVKKDILAARAKQNPTPATPAAIKEATVKAPEKEKEKEKDRPTSGGMLAPVKNLFTRSKKEEKKEPEKVAEKKQDRTAEKKQEKVAEKKQDKKPEEVTRDSWLTSKKPEQPKTLPPATTVEAKKPAGGFAGIKNPFQKKQPEPTPTVTATKKDETPKPTLLPEAKTVTFNEPKVEPPPVVAPPKEPVKVARPETKSIPTTTASTGDTTEQARGMISAGRKALAKGELDLAAGYAEKARALKPDLQYWEDNPERLIRAIQIAYDAAEGKTSNPTKTVSRTVTAKEGSLAPARNAQEAQALLKEGRGHLNEGKLEEVGVVLQRVRGYTGKYGLFEDSPDKLQKDLVKVRAKREKTESVKVLADARRAYEAGELDKATQLAYKAQQLHGGYSVWDLGDRPNKLLDDIENAKERKQAAEVLARRKPNTEETKTETVVASKEPKTETPKTVSPKVELPSPEREQALRLMAEARALQTQGKLLTARKKLTEAEALKVTFKGDEESPAQMQLQLAALAQQRSQQQADRAFEIASSGTGDPRQNYEQAEAAIQQARKVAVAFNLDVSGMDEKLGHLAQLKLNLDAPKTNVAANPMLPTPPLTTPPVLDKGKGGMGDVTAKVEVPPTEEMKAKAHGLTLLEQARMELRKGQTSVARRLAEQAYTGNYGVQPQAEQRLREIDIEEFNQKRLATLKSFDAGMAAFNRRDYPQAREILTGIKPAQLDQGRQARLKEIMSIKEMGSPETLTASNIGDATPAAVVRVSDRGEGPKIGEVAPRNLADDPLAGKKSVSDDHENDLLKITKGMQTIRMQALRDESLKVQRSANDRASQGDTDGAIALLQEYLGKLPESQLDSEKLAYLRRPIESRIQKYKLMEGQAEMDKQVASKKVNPGERKLQLVMQKVNKDKHVADLMKQYTDYFRQGKYREAEQYAKLVLEIDPDNAVAGAGATIARTQARLAESNETKAQKEKFNYEAIKDTNQFGKYTSIKNPLVVDEERSKFGKNRPIPSIGEVTKAKNQAHREIESKLDSPVNLNFSDAPLKQVIDFLRASNGINIQPDYFALKQENISLERPVTATLNGISLKSALNVVLRQVELVWVIRDDVLLLTTPANAKGNLITKTYLVADLVTPVPDHAIPDISLWEKQMERLANQNTPGYSPPTPRQGNGLRNGSNVGSSSSSGGDFAASAIPDTTGSPNSNASPGQAMARTGPAAALPQQLINLIKNTIDPDSWKDLGGASNIDYFPLGMTLVINQTPDIQEQIADLLQQLRRLQDLEVVIEVRIISLSDDFFERMGVNFDMKIKTDQITNRYEPELIRGLTTGQFKAPGYVQDYSPSRFLAGITPAKTFTSDLDIPITPSSFGLANVPFGLTGPLAGNTTGGLSFGLAFLSDIQVFFFMEAAQGDQRYNVMQSPKIVAFNGQSVSLQANTTGTFVTGVNMVVGPTGSPLFFPINSPITYGSQLNVQPVVTGDRRFVRVNVSLNMTNPVPNINVFPVVVPVIPQVLDGGFTGNQPQTPAILTQFIQQIGADTLSVQTTAVVPDGGTVLLGGLKRLSEGRNEFGPPILSKIPYLNRLVKNVGYGREVDNILMMITPRIVINEEEEIIQTGVISNPGLVQ